MAALNRMHPDIGLVIKEKDHTVRLYNLEQLQAKQLQHRAPVYKLYATMRPVWNSLENHVRAMPLPADRLFALFLKLCSKIRSVDSTGGRVWALRRTAWCWYHTETTGLPTVHVEAKLLSDGFGRRLARQPAATLLIMSELLTVMEATSTEHVNPSDERAVIDQQDSEIEWRRGLHSSRRQVRLC